MKVSRKLKYVKKNYILHAIQGNKKSIEAEKKNKEACKSWQNLDTFAQLITLSYILKEK